MFCLNTKLILYCFVFSRTTWSQQCIRHTSNEWRFQQGFASKGVMKIRHNFTGCLTLKNCFALLFLIHPGGLSRGQSKTKTSVTRVFKGFSSMIGGATLGNHIKNMFSSSTLPNFLTTLIKIFDHFKIFIFAIWLFFGSFAPFGRYLKIFFRNLNWSLQFFDDAQNFG